MGGDTNGRPVTGGEEDRPRVLVVEDRTRLAETVADTLRSLGFGVAGVLQDGGRALRSTRHDPPDLVLMDVDLSGARDGIETAEAIREIHPEVPVLFFSGRTDEETLERAVRGGGYGYLVKPLTRSRLAAAVRTAVGIRAREARSDDVAPSRPAAADLPVTPAWRDPITGLVGRRQLEGQAEKMVALAERRGEHVAVVLLDVARFGRVNASLGYEVGDRALSRVAERLREAVRDSDALARVGGDEFVVVMTDVDGVDGAAAGARRLVGTLDEPLRLGDASLRLTLEAGVALFPLHGREVEPLVRAATVALHSSRRDGQTRVKVFEEGRSGRADGQMAISAEIERALQEDELAVHYQPIFQIPEGGIAGMEALVRWNHPDRGELSAGAFVPQAEEMRVIRQLDHWMLEHVIGDLRRWPAEHRPSWVSVNLSADSVRDPTLPTRMRGLLESRVTEEDEDTAFGDARLVVEITERSAVRDFGAVTEVLSRLGRLGVVAALDDFGTGHSSLVYLDRLPVEFLKLDRRFLSSVAEPGNGGRLTTAILELGRALEMKVIAEGVERDPQYRWLQENDVRFVQGFLTGEPGPIEAFLP